MENLFKNLDSQLILGGKNFLIAVIIMIVGWWLINKLSKVYLIFFQKASFDTGLISFFDSLIKFLRRVLLIVGVLDFLGFNTTSIVTAIGASFIAIGISLKDSLTNIVSGIILIINKPVHVGDYVELDGVKGTIIKIEMLFSFLKSSENSV